MLLIKVAKAILIFGIAILVISCRGKAAVQLSDRLPNTIGTMVAELDTKVLVIYQDNNENFWFGGGKKGVYKYDGQNLVLFTTDDGLCSNTIIGIQEDKLGNLFFDTPKGISKFDGQTFSTLPVVDRPISNHSWTLEPDDLWFRMGWGKDGPYRYNGQFLYHLKFPKPERVDSFYAKHPNVTYSPYDIYAIYKDPKGNMWFGTSSLGACRYDGKTLSWFYEKHLTQTPGGGDFGIRAIYQDRNGYFWFCNSQYRYNILPGHTEKNKTNYINYERERGVTYSDNKNDIKFPYFMSIAEDTDGNLWMVTYDNGVWRNNGQRLIHYPIKDGNKNVLLFSIYKDRHDALWLGSHNAGVFKFNGVTFEKFMVN